ncbi:MAG: NUDIX hydrolase [Eubacterium sp.]|nr:NUDIX hydrolase [Eubacterium sp.]
MTEEEFLEEYKKQVYPKPAVTADTVLISEEDNECKVLLIKRGNHPCKDCFAFPGGFAEPGETIDMAARRELLEETGVDIPNLQPIRVFSAPNRDPRGWTMTEAYIGKVKADELQVSAGDDASDARWFSLSHKRDGEERSITLTYKEETISIRVSGMEDQGLMPKIKLLSSENIAFDHGLIMAYALHRYEYLKRTKEW